MKKNELGNNGPLVTPVGMGVMTIGESQLDLPLEEGARLIRYAYDSGIIFFDTAQYYKTYPYMREAFRGVDMSRNNPDRPVISSKCLDSSYDAMNKAIEEYMSELSTDFIDIFLLHEVRGEPDWEERSGAWQCLKERKADGTIGAIGVSTHHVDTAELVASVPECDVLFPLINYAGLGIRKGDGQGTAEEMSAAIKKCLSLGKGVFAMKAFGGGNLSGEYRKALDFVKALGVQSIMVGIGKQPEVDRIIEYAEGTLAPDYAPDISGKKIRVSQGDCEGCGACLSRCPNKAIFMNEKGLAEVNCDICLTCGYCAPVCPARAIILW